MNDFKPTVLITGANGFVGARLCRKFINEGFQVFAGVRKSANLSNLAGLNVVFRYGDVTRPETLPEMVAGVDYLIHNAGVTKAKSNSWFFEVNEQGTRSLFEAIKKHNPTIKKAVYISSLAGVGPSYNEIPVNEATLPNPLTTYGKSKLAGEGVALSFGNDFSVVSVRPPGVYGPGDKEIFSFFQTVASRIKPYIGNTSRKLQLVHVDDLCRGIFLAATKPTEPGAKYFIAENRSYTMKELIALLEQAVGKKAYPLYIPAALFKIIARISQFLFRIVGATPMLTIEKANELLASWEVSIEKAATELGYRSEIPFKDGAVETFIWYKKEGWL